MVLLSRLGHHRHARGVRGPRVYYNSGCILCSCCKSIITVAILAQGTSRAGAETQAFYLMLRPEAMLLVCTQKATGDGPLPMLYLSSATANKFNQNTENEPHSSSPLSIRLSIHPSVVYPSIHRSIYPSINLLIHSTSVASAMSSRRKNRHRGDSNPCGQSPMDFESISLAARTQCHCSGHSSSRSGHRSRSKSGTSTSGHTSPINL